MSATESLIAWATPTTLVVYTLACLLPSIYMARQARKLRGDSALNQKYYAFHRHDIENWTVLRLFLSSFLLLFPVRFAIAWCCVLW